ncbi:hypothetical protein GF323_02695 [Candidatus Woesearchaeota archaeon]|nr:hypothetical protein [Candidatus Woesearchaeota archaeon]
MGGLFKEVRRCLMKGHEDIYNEEYREDMSENDEINAFEEAFMQGYGEAI